MGEYIHIYHTGKDSCGQQALWYRSKQLVKGAFVISENARWPDHSKVMPCSKLICFHCKKPIYIEVIEDEKYAHAITATFNKPEKVV